jgi:hypothetical protein
MVVCPSYSKKTRFQVPMMLPLVSPPELDEESLQEVRNNVARAIKDRVRCFILDYRL